jgi:hypothetical protein
VSAPSAGTAKAGTTAIVGVPASCNATRSAITSSAMLWGEPPVALPRSLVPVRITARVPMSWRQPSESRSAHVPPRRAGARAKGERRGFEVAGVTRRVAYCI